MALLLTVLAACSPQAAAPAATPTEAATATSAPSPTSTPDPLGSLAPEVQELFKSQNAIFTLGADGSIQIDLYDTTEKETITPTSFLRVDTNDGLNPNILTAQDVQGNDYAYNPDLGWFKVPNVYNPDIDWAQTLADLSVQRYRGFKEINELLNPANGNYTEVSKDFFTDGRANIVTALQYAANPTISPDAIIPHYWASFSGFGPCIYISFFPGSYLVVQTNLADLALKSYYSIQNKPFVLQGFYKVNFENEEIAYVIARTQKNPTNNRPNQLVNLFYGIDQKIYEQAANTITAIGRSGLTADLQAINAGDLDFALILAPPIQINGLEIPWDSRQARISRGETPSLNIGLKHSRGELLSLFSEADQKEMQNIIYTNLYESGVSSTSTIDYLPTELSNLILQASSYPNFTHNH